MHPSTKNVLFVMGRPRCSPPTSSPFQRVSWHHCSCIGASDAYARLSGSRPFPSGQSTKAPPRQRTATVHLAATGQRYTPTHTRGYCVLPCWSDYSSFPSVYCSAKMEAFFLSLFFSVWRRKVHAKAAKRIGTSSRLVQLQSTVYCKTATVYKRLYYCVILSFWAARGTPCLRDAATDPGA